MNFRRRMLGSVIVVPAGMMFMGRRDAVRSRCAVRICFGVSVCLCVRSWLIVRDAMLRRCRFVMRTVRLRRFILNSRGVSVRRLRRLMNIGHGGVNAVRFSVSDPFGS